MKTIIVYASKHGTTESVAGLIAQKLQGNVEQKNIKKEKNIDLSQFDRVIIGGSIHAGQIQRKVKSFCEKNMVTLLHKEIGLFLSCMDDKKAQEQFDNNFQEVLRNHAKGKAIIGGEFRMEKMNFIERGIVKKVAGIENSVSSLKPEKIDEFVHSLLV